jgi:hypothetical protein
MRSRQQRCDGGTAGVRDGINCKYRLPLRSATLGILECRARGRAAARELRQVAHVISVLLDALCSSLPLRTITPSSESSSTFVFASA